jgi:hypothetical protein
MYRYASESLVFKQGLVRCTKDGIPSFLGDVIPIIRSKDQRSIQAILSILTLGRLYTGVGDLVLDPIISDSNISDNITDAEIQDFVQNNDLLIDEVSQPEFFIRSSTGPSGPAMTSIIQEAKNLPDALYEDIVRILPPNMIEVLDQCRTQECYAIPSFQQDTGNHSIRKITVVEDKEFKNRVIAIFDYWSQLCLKPLHIKLMSKLKGMSQDCTYNQTGGVKAFLEKNKENFYSLDLEGATDRMPAALQLRLLSMMLSNEEDSTRYFRILNDYPFDTKLGKVKYKVGQPMGAYSSWALMSLTHHLMVWTAMRRSKSHHNQYMLLGDDLVICGHEFAASYKVIVQDLGMNISSFKSLESKTSFEFAKRFYVKGQEWSPLPIGQLKHAMTQY